MKQKKKNKLSGDEKSFFDNYKKRYPTSKDLTESNVSELADKIAKYDKKDRGITHAVEAAQYLSGDNENLNSTDNYVKDSWIDLDAISLQGGYKGVYDKLDNLKRMSAVGAHKEKVDTILNDFKNFAEFENSLPKKNTTTHGVFMSKIFKDEGSKGLNQYIDDYKKLPEFKGDESGVLKAVFANSLRDMRKGDFSALTTFKKPKNEAVANEIKSSLNEYKNHLSEVGIKVPEEINSQINKKLGKFA